MILFFKSIWTFFDDCINYLSKIFRRQMLQLLLKFHLLMIGNLIIVLLFFKKVVLNRLFLFIFACPRLSYVIKTILPGTIIGMLGK